MNDKKTKALGYAWLAEHYGIAPVNQLTTTTESGPASKIVVSDGIEFNISTAKVSAEPRDHLSFAIKSEGVHLEFLARLFDRLTASEVAEWVTEDNGQSARKIGFLYEWLTDSTLPITPSVSGNYYDVLDPSRYVVAKTGTQNTRWRVRDNLPGTRDFCPTIRRTDTVRRAEAYDPNAEIEALQIEYGTDILLKSAGWLTTKESRASFQIEHEQDQTDRIKRFAVVMEKHAGKLDAFFDPATLEMLQREIIGDRTTIPQLGLRQSPVYVGSASKFVESVEYIAPNYESVPALMRGLADFEQRTRGAPSVIRAAATSFAFVYIHPFADGNGRMHRFLINDILRRDNALKAPFLLPVSATIISNAATKREYDRVLEVLSQPLMARYAGAHEFGAIKTYPDGVRSNFEFPLYADAEPAWQYPDLTKHVEYVYQLIDSTIRHELRNEASYLRALTNAREAVKEFVEGPNFDIDRIIRSVNEATGPLSNKLLKEFPVLRDPDLAADVVKAIKASFAEHTGEAALTPAARAEGPAPT